MLAPGIMIAVIWIEHIWCVCPEAEARFGRCCDAVCGNAHHPVRAQWVFSLQHETYVEDLFVTKGLAIRQT